MCGRAVRPAPGSGAARQRGGYVLGGQGSHSPHCGWLRMVGVEVPLLPSQAPLAFFARPSPAPCPCSVREVEEGRLVFVLENASPAEEDAVRVQSIFILHEDDNRFWLRVRERHARELAALTLSCRTQGACERPGVRCSSRSPPGALLSTAAVVDACATKRQIHSVKVRRRTCSTSNNKPCFP